MAETLLNQNNQASTKENLTSDDILDALNIDDAEPDTTDLLGEGTPEKGKVSEEDKTKDKEDEQEGKGDEEEETPPEEDLELTAEDLITPVRRKEILAKYPDLFKTFPYLEKAMYREQQYTEILPSLEDAKLAVEKSNRLDVFEDSVLKGSTATVLKSVKESDPKAFGKIVDSYLDDLRNVDQAAYAHVITSTMKQLITGMVGEARKINSEELGKAAVIVNQFLFGRSEFTPPEKFTKEEPVNEEAEQLKTERMQFVQERLDATINDLGSRTDNAIKSTININIDPKNLMTPYVKKNAINDAFQEVDRIIRSDTRFQAMKNKLWERAMQSNFSKVATDQIKNAYLSYAKTVLPAAIKKARIEALKGMGKRVDDTPENESRNRKGPVPAGRSSSPSSDRGKGSEKPSIPRGMTTLDFLNSD